MPHRTAFAVAAAGALLACPSASAQPRGAPDLARYEGKTPFDPVAGVRFLSHPLARRAVANAAPSARMRNRILREGTSAPIVVTADMVLANACEPHNCGPHNWSILVGRRSPVHIVCYLANGASVARWYRRGRQIATSESCASDASQVPSAVVNQL